MSQRIKNTYSSIAALQKVLEIEKSLKVIYKLTGVAVCLSGLLLIADTVYLLRYGVRVNTVRPNTTNSFTPRSTSTPTNELTMCREKLSF